MVDDEDEDDDEDEEELVILEVMVGWDLLPLLLTDQPTGVPRGIFPVFLEFGSTSFDLEFLEDPDRFLLPFLLPEDEEEEEQFCCVPWEVNPCLVLCLFVSTDKPGAPPDGTLPR